MTGRSRVTGRSGATEPGVAGQVSPPERPARPWYARGWILAVALAVVIGGISVLVDFPHRTSDAQQVREATSVVKTVNSSIRPCTFAVAQAFSLFRRERAGTLSAAQRSQVPGLVADDQRACSFANTSVVRLGTTIFGTLTLSSTPAGRDLTVMVKSVLDWMTSDAQAAIDDIQKLGVDPGDPTARRDLSTREAFLAKDRASADAAVGAADRALGSSSIPEPALPDLPRI